MKIAFVGGARYSQPLDPTSEKKFRVLRELGDLYIIGFSKNLLPRKFTRYGHFYLLPKLPFATARYGEMFLLGTVLAFWLILRHEVRILVAQSPYEGFAAALAKNAAAAFGVKVELIVESHGDFEESLFLQRRILFPALYRFIMRYAARFALKHGDRLRAVSDSTRRQLEQWVSGKTIHQFTTWTDIDVFCRAGKEAGHKFGESILYTGMLIPRKGVHHLVRAFAEIVLAFPEARLIIMGGEENRGYAAELKYLVKQSGLDGRVEFTGEVTQADLAQRMGQARVFVLPTYSEGLPRVVIEAMAAGLPVVATAASGIPEVIEDGVTGFLVPPGDEAALAQRLRWVLDNPEKAEEVGCRARDFVQRFFSTERYVDGYAAVFKESRTNDQESEAVS